MVLDEKYLLYSVLEIDYIRNSKNIITGRVHIVITLYKFFIDLVENRLNIHIFIAYIIFDAENKIVKQ